MRRVTYLYEDPAHPERPSGHLESPEWTPDDRALFLALQMYEDTLCPGGCGQPKELAWHSAMEGWFEATEWVCHACSARQGHEARFSIVEVDKDLPLAVVDAFDPFEIGVTTTEPTKTET